MSVFHVSVLLLTMNFIITLSKWSADPLGYQLHGDNVLTKFMINNRTDAWKTDVNLLNNMVLKCDLDGPRYLPPAALHTKTWQGLWKMGQIWNRHPGKLCGHPAQRIAQFPSLNSNGLVTQRYTCSPGSSSINLTSCKTKDQASKWWNCFPSWISRKKENPHDNVVKLCLARSWWKALIGAKLPPSANRLENYSTVNVNSHAFREMTDENQFCCNFKRKTKDADWLKLEQGNGIRPRLTDNWWIWTSPKKIVCFAKLVAYPRCISASFTSFRWRGAKLGVCEFFLERNMPEE